MIGSDICDWSIKNQIALAYWTDRPPFFVTSSDKFPLDKRYQDRRCDILVFTPSITDPADSDIYNKVSNVIRVNQTVHSHDDFIQILKWNDTGTRLLSVDSSGKLCVWSIELSLFSDVDFSDLKKRSLLGFQSLNEGFGFTLCTVSGKIFYFYEQDESYSEISSFISLKDFSVSEFHHTCQNADLMITSDNSCLLAIHVNQSILLLGLHLNILEDFILSIRISYLNEVRSVLPRSLFKLFKQNRLILVEIDYNHIDFSTRISFFDCSSSSNASPPRLMEQFITNDVQVHSLARYKIKSVVQKDLLILGTSHGKMIIFNQHCHPYSCFEWPLTFGSSDISKAVASEPTKLSSDVFFQFESCFLFPITAACISPNESSIMVLQEHSRTATSKKTARFFSIHVHLARISHSSFTKPLIKDRKYIISIYNHYDITGLRLITRGFINKEEDQELNGIILSNISKILLKNSNEVIVFQNLLHQSRSIKLKQMILNTLKLYSILDQLTMCFDNPYSVRASLESGKDISAEIFSERYVAHVVPLGMFVIEMSIKILRQCYAYFKLVNVNQPAIQSWEHGSMLFCPIYRSIMVKIFKIFILIESKLTQSTDENKFKTHYCALLQDYMFGYSIKLDELKILHEDIGNRMDSILTNQANNSIIGQIQFDDLNDIYMKGILPKRYHDNISFMADFKKILLDRAPKIHDFQSRFLSKANELISPDPSSHDSSITTLGNPAAITGMKNQLKEISAFFSVPMTMLIEADKNSICEIAALNSMQMSEPGTMEFVDKIRKQYDGLTHLSLARAKTIKQCDRCGNYANGESRFNTKWNQPPKQHVKDDFDFLSVASPMINLYSRQCFCGGSWIKIIDSSMIDRKMGQIK